MVIEIIIQMLLLVVLMIYHVLSQIGIGRNLIVLGANFLGPILHLCYSNCFLHLCYTNPNTNTSSQIGCIYSCGWVQLQVYHMWDRCCFVTGTDCYNFGLMFLSNTTHNLTIPI